MTEVIAVADVVRGVLSLRTLPSMTELADMLSAAGWRPRESSGTGRAFEHGACPVFVHAGDGQVVIEFELQEWSESDSDGDNAEQDYREPLEALERWSTAILCELRDMRLEKLSRALGPSMLEAVDATYYRYGDWVVTLGLVHPELLPVSVALRIDYLYGITTWDELGVWEDDVLVEPGVNSVPIRVTGSGTTPPE